MKNECKRQRGGFTLPGEAGYESLTLEMARKWGADVIRDSDGTVLSDEILQAGYDIYSTICIIRDHNEWAKQHPEQLQQTFLMTEPRVMTEEYLEIVLLADFYTEQFTINDSKTAFDYWQVYDRTEGIPLDASMWKYDKEKGSVRISLAPLWHKYSVSFMAYRIWEEISMYNHITNNWVKEHLMQIDPIYPEVKAYLKKSLKDWCDSHPDTNVVRFTSMFYNFVWIWGSDERRRNIFTDWGSYDFTVSALGLKKFEEEFGYALTAEDFVNQGKYQVSHMPADTHKRDWMEFVNRNVVGTGRELVDIVHNYGKKAYVFYDDSWVGVEPYHDRFAEFGFDGLIKCVFSGFEVRLCGDVKVDTHEIRLHPYLFPVGLGGAPTFMEGGNPTLDARKYWINIRRALLQKPIERIGLGGYLHLVEQFPDFCDYMEKVADEFRFIRQLHEQGQPYILKPKVAILHYWGSLRSWTLSGHFHESYMHDLIHVLESLSGMPLDISFINFDDVKEMELKLFDVIINAGCAGDAWSGGSAWADVRIVEKLTKWACEGGAFIGIRQPCAYPGADTLFRMAHVLGVDMDDGARVNHGKWEYNSKPCEVLKPELELLSGNKAAYLINRDVRVLAEDENGLILTVHEFGKGRGIYLSNYQISDINTRFLLDLILYGSGHNTSNSYLTSNPYTECAYYPKSDVLILINNSGIQQETEVSKETETIRCVLEPYESMIIG